MSEIKVNKIKSALNHSKVVFKSGIQVNDFANPLIPIPFEITNDGKTVLLKEIQTGNFANKLKGEEGEVLLSRGEKLSPRWGPVPTSPCPPVAETGKLFAGGFIPSWSSASWDAGFVPQCLLSYGLARPLQELGIGGDAFGKKWKKLSFAHIRAGAGITEDGELYTWGYANSGRLGNGFYALGLNGDTINPSGAYEIGTSTPIPGNYGFYYVKCPYRVGTENNWVDVITTTEWTAAIKSNGTMWIWGANHYGTYGNGTYLPYTTYSSTTKYVTDTGQSTIPSAEPTRLGTDSNWVKFAEKGNANYTDTRRIIALKTDGTIWSWGSQRSWSGGPLYGHLGHDTSELQSIEGGNYMAALTPKQILISGGQNNDWVSAFTTEDNVFGIKRDGSLWGFGATEGLLTGYHEYMQGAQKPTGWSNQTHKFVKMSGPGYSRTGSPSGAGKWKKIIRSGSLGNPHSYFGLQEDGSVWAWGFNCSHYPNSTVPGSAGILTPGGYLAIGPNHPITNVPWPTSLTVNGKWDPNCFVTYPVKLNNEKYLDINGTGENSGAVLIRIDGTLWITGYASNDTNTGGGVWVQSYKFQQWLNDYNPLPFVYPYQPKWSRSLIWSSAFLIGVSSYDAGGESPLTVVGSGEEIPTAPIGSTVMWLRRNYTSLKGITAGACNSIDVKTGVNEEPSLPSGWIYCDGLNGTRNMKTYVNPVTKLFDWPPIDNNDGCGDSPQSQNGTISGQITYIKKI